MHPIGCVMQWSQIIRMTCYDVDNACAATGEWHVLRATLGLSLLIDNKAPIQRRVSPQPGVRDSKVPANAAFWLALI